MYILFFEAHFKLSRIFTKNFWRYTLIRLGIRLFTNSRFHHVAFTLEGKLITEAIYSVGYRVISWKESFKHQRNVNVYAYKINRGIDLDKFKKFQKKLINKPYDLKGAFFSGVPTFLEVFFKKNKKNWDNKDVFCSEAMIMLANETFIKKGENWTEEINNINSYDPEEFRKALIDKDIIIENKIILAWKGDKKGREIYRATDIFK